MESLPALLSPATNYDQVYQDIIIRTHHERRLVKGHLWAFSNELATVDKSIPPGTVVRLVREFDKKPFALAFYHPNSLISARVISRDIAATIDADFLRQRIAESAARRAFIEPERNAIRLVHSESDLLPGLVIERYDDICTFQIVSAGMEAMKSEIISIIDDLFSPASIIEKNSSHLRTLEGLPEVEAIVKGSKTVATIYDRAGTRMEIDLLSGQKTGGYLDQMDNRTLIRRYVTKSSNILDLFCNEGGFSLNAALAGAQTVTAVDASKLALARVEANRTLNPNSAEWNLVNADCFEYLKTAEGQYDVVVVDPPSLAKSKKHLKNALEAYLSLHRGAMKLLAPGGVLLTASCSHHFGRTDLHDVVRDAAGTLRRTACILEDHGAGADHPVHAVMPETEYLHFMAVRVF